MRKRNQYLVAAVVLVAIVSIAQHAAAIIPALRANGLQLSTNGSTPVQSTKAGLWVDNSGPPVRLRFDDGTTSNYVMTSSSSASGGTLPTDYAAGGTGPQVLALDSTRKGLVVRDNASPIGGTLLGVDDGAGNKYFDVSASSGIQLLGAFNLGANLIADFTLTNNSAATAGAGTQQWAPAIAQGGRQWNGAASVDTAWLSTVRPVTGSTSAGEYVMFARYNGLTPTESYKVVYNFLGTGGTALVAPNTTYFAFLDSGNNGMKTTGGTTTLRAGGGDIVSTDGTAWYPNSDLTITSGKSAARYTETWSRSYAGVSQSLAHSTTPAFDCTAGETIHIGPVTANITGPTMVAGKIAQKCTIVLLKDGTAGTFTLAGWGANTRTSGTLTFSSTASSVMTISFRWDDRLGTPAWVETGRATGL